MSDPQARHKLHCLQSNELDRAASDEEDKLKRDGLDQSPKTLKKGLARGSRKDGGRPETSGRAEPLGCVWERPLPIVVRSSGDLFCGDKQV
jgi:hypothetical protein